MRSKIKIQRPSKKLMLSCNPFRFCLKITLRRVLFWPGRNAFHSCFVSGNDHHFFSYFLKCVQTLLESYTCMRVVAFALLLFFIIKKGDPFECLKERNSFFTHFSVKKHLWCGIFLRHRKNECSSKFIFATIPEQRDLSSLF